MSMNGLIVAMENAENGEADTSELAAAQTETAVVQDSADVAAVSDEIGDDTANAEAVAADAEQLEEIGEVAQEAVESGEGLSEDAAAMATIAVERIHQRLFGTRKQRIIPATESFGQTNTRLSSTKMIVESVGETLERIWKGIKAFVARIWDKIKLMIAKLLGSSKMNGKHIENLRQRIRDIPSDYEPKEEKLKNESLAKSISVDGSANASTFAVISANAKNLAKFGEDVCGIRSNLVALAARAVANPKSPDYEKFTKENGLFSFNVNKAGKALLALSSSKTAAAITASAKNEDGVKRDAYGPFVNNTAMVVEESTLGDGTKAVRLSFAQVPGKDHKVADEAVALDRNGMLTVLKEAETINDEVATLQKVEKEAAKLTKDLDNLCDSVLKTVGTIAEKTNQDKDVQRALAEAKRGANDSLGVVNALVNSGPSFMAQTVTAGMNYVSASLANMKPKK